MEKKSVWLKYTEAEKKKAFAFADEYKEFLSNSKTEREVTEYIINELCIRTDRQGAGAGTFFIREIEKAVRELGLKQIFLLTDSNVPACEFYRKNGFTECTSNVAFAKSVE